MHITMNITKESSRMLSAIQIIYSGIKLEDKEITPEDEESFKKSVYFIINNISKYIDNIEEKQEIREALYGMFKKKTSTIQLSLEPIVFILQNPQLRRKIG